MRRRDDKQYRKRYFVLLSLAEKYFIEKDDSSTWEKAYLEKDMEKLFRKVLKQERDRLGKTKKD